MFTYNIRVDVLWVNAEIVAKQITQSCGIQRCACTDDLCSTKARKLKGNARHDINRVCCYEEDTVKARFYDRCDYRTEHLDISLQKVEPCFALLLCNARCYHNDICAAAVLIVACLYLHIGFCKRKSVVKVHSLAVCLVLVNVYKHELVADAALIYQRIRKAHTYHSRADKHDLSCISSQFYQNLSN